MREHSNLFIFVVAMIGSSGPLQIIIRLFETLSIQGVNSFSFLGIFIVGFLFTIVCFLWVSSFLLIIDYINEILEESK